MADKEEPSLAGVPIFFADQGAAMQLGALISKLTLGVAEADDKPYPRPIVTIVMPTHQLLALANDLRKALSDPAFRQDAAADLKRVIGHLESSDYSTPKEGFIAAGKPVRRARKKPGSTH